MEAYAILDSDQVEADTKFDILCTLCRGIFAEGTAWNDEKYRYAHHDIYSLIKSAQAKCHLCNLMLGQISVAHVERMQNDIDTSTVAPGSQICLGIDRFEFHSLKIYGFAAFFTAAQEEHTTGIETIELGYLNIRPAVLSHPDNRSVAATNCSSSTMATIMDWLRECVDSHVKCSELHGATAIRQELPTRLLDLNHVARKGIVKLIASESLLQDTKYATLSHCWGGGCGKTLTVENLEQMKDGFPISSVPKTFQHAIVLTTRLGVQYLWIDALCIIQDTVNDADWRHEAAMMGDVYANSYFTLAATTSANSEGGLLHDRNVLSVWPCRLKMTWNSIDPEDYVISGPKPSVNGPHTKPLGDRAWAFQEWLLSRRLIHFSNDQVRWECYSLAADESYPKGYPAGHFGFSGIRIKTTTIDFLKGPKAGIKTWGNIRREYSGKLLTRATDKLAALSGITRMVHKLLDLPPEDYLAGLSKGNLLQELLWCRNGAARSTHGTGAYIAPSWSWASLNGPFLELFGDNYKARWYAEVRAAKTSPVDDPFGPVRNGSIVLKGPLRTINVSPPPQRILIFDSDDHQW